MIVECHGDLLKANVESLINPVNTDGVMGAGLAKDFKQYYPDMFLEYQHKCFTRELKIGTLHLFKTGYRRYIINFPTKSKWNQPSQLEYIAKGLEALTDLIYTNGIRSIALPPLGCGLGKLNWEDVKPLIDKWSRTCPDIAIKLYLPREHHVHYHRRITSLST